MREGQKVIDTMIKKDAADLTAEDVEQFAKDLSTFATEIVDDFEEQRENLSDKQGLLDTWEENTGFQSEEWDTVVTDLDNYTVDDEDDLDGEIASIIEMWEQGPQ
jgi:hypothetical protein